MSAPIRVVVVEDSAVQRAHLVALLEREGRIEVVEQATDVAGAVDAVGRHAPDVVTMDLEIPGGPADRPGGVVALERIMERIPVPVLALSAHAAPGGTLAIEALDAGAVDVFPKPGRWTDEDAAALRRRIGVLSRVPVVRRTPRRTPPAVPAATPPPGRAGPGPVVGLVASTGGPSALREVLRGLHGLPAPILVVQHIHPDFTGSFATWLQDATGVPVRVAERGARPCPGTVHVAPPGLHLRLGPGGRLDPGAEPRLRSVPSGDELLRSLAVHAGADAIGVVLTGMGDDGADGLLAIRRRGGATIAQDEATSVVDGMPRVARERGAAEQVLPLGDVADAVAAQVRRRAAR